MGVAQEPHQFRNDVLEQERDAPRQEVVMNPPSSGPTAAAIAAAAPTSA